MKKIILLVLLNLNYGFAKAQPPIDSLPKWRVLTTGAVNVQWGKDTTTPSSLIDSLHKYDAKWQGLQIHYDNKPDTAYGYAFYLQKDSLFMHHDEAEWMELDTLRINAKKKKQPKDVGAIEIDSSDWLTVRSAAYDDFVRIDVHQELREAIRVTIFGDYYKSSCYVKDDSGKYTIEIPIHDVLFWDNQVIVPGKSIYRNIFSTPMLIPLSNGTHLSVSY